MSKNKIIITGGRAPVALDLARQFAQAGYFVIGVESTSPNLLFASKYCHQTRLVSAPRFKTKEYIEEITKIILEEKVKIVIPTCEEIFYLSMNLDILKETGATIWCPEFEILKKFHSKWIFNQLVNEKLPAPKTNIFSNAIDLHREIVKLNQKQKFVLKKEYSRFAAKTDIDYPSSLLKNIESILIDESNKWLLQECIEGQEYCTYSLAKEGKLLAHTTYIHDYTAGRGAGISFESIDHSKIENWVKDWCSKFNYTGQICFDFIENAQGVVYPLECNPRATSGLHLLCMVPDFIQCFIDNASALNNSTITRCQPKTLASIKLAMFVYGLSQGLKSLQQFKSWLKIILSAKEVIFSFRDWKPFFVQFYVFYLLIIKAKKLKITPLEASTLDIEYNT